MTELALIRSLVLEKTQNIISDEKAQVVLERLRREYPGKPVVEAVEQLKSRIGAPSWLTEIVSINETFFFRHPEQFETLRKQLARLGEAGAIEALCAGVSSGQEAYSLAILLEESLPKERSFLITGVDIDSHAIEVAKAGRYTQLDIDRTPSQFRPLLLKHMMIENGPNGPSYIIREEIRKRIRFICGNIFSSLLNRYQLIFIRNILIYFKEEDRSRLLLRLREKLAPNGIVFIGAGELFPRSLAKEVSPTCPYILEKRAA